MSKLNHVIARFFIFSAMYLLLYNILILTPFPFTEQIYRRYSIYAILWYELSTRKCQVSLLMMITAEKNYGCEFKRF